MDWYVPDTGHSLTQRGEKPVLHKSFVLDGNGARGLQLRRSGNRKSNGSKVFWLIYFTNLLIYLFSSAQISWAPTWLETLWLAVGLNMGISLSYKKRCLSSKEARCLGSFVSGCPEERWHLEVYDAGPRAWLGRKAIWWEIIQTGAYERFGSSVKIYIISGVNLDCK